MYVDAELQSLRLAPVVDAFTVENPALRITHLGQGRYVDDVIMPSWRPQNERQTPHRPPRLALYNLLLRAGASDFTDNAVGKTTFGARPACCPCRSSAPCPTKSARGPRHGVHAGRQPF